MGRTFVRQATQISSSDLYDDTVAAGSTLESAPTNIEDDLNGARSQAKRAIWADTAGNWYDDIQTVNGKKRAITQLNTDLDDIEEKRILFREQKQTPDITVGAADNWVTLSQAGGETPTQAAAVNGGTAEGAVVASLGSGNDVGAHSLNLVSGPNALNPKNMVLVVDSSTGQPLQSGGEDIFGLLQVEDLVVDGDAFNDTNHQAQISFVISNAGRTALIACPAVDIQGKIINYSYVRRVKFDNIPEYAFLTGAFLDESATSEITLDRAVDNQSGAVTQAQNIDWNIADTFRFDFRDPSGVRNLFKVLPASGNDAVSFDVDSWDVDNVNRGRFLNGVRFDSGGTAIDVGDVAGNISSAGLLKLLSGGGVDLSLAAALELNLTDSYRSGSTWSLADGIALANSIAEWSAFETAFGEVSLLNAITQASNSNFRSKTVAVVTTNAAADVNLTGAGGSPNLDAQLGDYSAKVFTTQVDVFLNGQLMRNGANAGANHDVYPGTSPANGDLKFEFAVKATGAHPDVITMLIY